MAPYDVLVDPQTVPHIPKANDPDEITSQNDAKESDKANEVSAWKKMGYRAAIFDQVSLFLLPFLCAVLFFA